MSRYQHAASPVYAILDNDEIVLAGKLMLIYTVQAALLGRAAQAIAVWQETGILQHISFRVHDTA